MITMNKCYILLLQSCKYLLIGVICCAFFSCQNTPENKVTIGNFPEDYPVLYPKYREWPFPAGNIEVTKNPAALLWPAASGEDASYDIRLSMDSTFEDESTITAQEIPWTIYNSHRQLKAGTWFWKYRIHNGKWSKLLQFEISKDTRIVNAPPVEKFWSSIPDEHPRVLITPKETSGFMRSAKNTKDAAVIIKAADNLLHAVPPKEREGLPTLKAQNKDKMEKIAQNASEHISNKAFNAIKLFCRAYILTGNKKYSDKGIAWALDVASWDPLGISHLSNFGDARCMVSMAWAYDTFYEMLTPLQRKQLLHSIEVRANGFYTDWTNHIDPKLLSNHVWQYIMDYFLQSSIAVYGDVDEAKKWIQYVYELWLARAPILGGKNGGWAGGIPYFRINMRTLLQMPMFIKQYTGFDYINNNPWYKKNVYWMIYSFPPGSACDGFGDDIEKIDCPGPFYLAYADAISKLTGDRVAAWYANRIEQYGNVKLTDDAEMRWFRMRYLQDMKRPKPVTDINSPSAMLFKDIGVVDMHSDITNTKNDLMISMRSSPWGSYSHMMAGQNTFNVVYGGKRLFYTSGYKIAMDDPHRLKWYKATIGHNGILIDGKGQPFGTKNAYGWIARFINGDHLTYAVGDASMAYGGRSEKTSTGLQKFRRHLLFIHPDILVVYDELTADHAAKWSWLIHSPYKIHLDTMKNEFYCSSNNASAVAKLFSSQPLTWALTDTFATRPINWLGRRDKNGNLMVYKNNSWHLTASARNNSPKMRFLTIIRVLNGSRIDHLQLEYSLDSSGNIQVGNWTIIATLNPAKPALLQVFRNDGKVAFTSSGKPKNISTQSAGKFKAENSSKLVELIDGKWTYLEAKEEVPDVVKEIPIDNNH